MATTTNYGWTTPNDTDLVKDGAAAIRTLGSSVDTTTKALNPSTTLGDIEYRSATANTNTRLGIGTTGQVLSVSSGVPAWTTISSGSMTLLSTTSLVGVTTVLISSINQGYQNIQFSIDNANWNGGVGGLTVRPNDVTTTAGAAFEASTNAAFTVRLGNATNYSPPATLTYKIDNYASTTLTKPLIVYGSIGSGTQYSGGGFFNDTTAITSIRISTTTGGTFAAGSVRVWGIN